MKMFLGFVLFAASADVISLQAYEELLKNGAAANGITKTVIASPVLEEALVSYAKNKFGGIAICGETCVHGTCYTPCEWPICKKNSLAAM